MAQVTLLRRWDAEAVLGLENEEYGSRITCFGTTLKGYRCCKMPPVESKLWIRRLEALTPSAAASSADLEEAAAASACHLHRGQYERIALRWSNTLLQYAKKNPSRNSTGSEAGGATSRSTYDAKVKAETENASKDDGPAWKAFNDLKLENSTLKGTLAKTQQDAFDLGEQYSRLFKQNFANMTRLKEVEEALERATKELGTLKEEQKKKQKKSEEISWAAAWKRYEDGWLEVQQSAGSLTEADIPWPTKLGTLTSTDGENIREFYKMAPRLKTARNLGAELERF
ncbi:hypothetical protein B0T11DRAFT_329922 [Plectosphaerella cucumerina]|uniref:Uncharacterized protein n=1 Tax=Plectosphaerella cucumerina TaxID=40658 RepID=A0A8K0X245_9PEZI|nr:hypothetical protein B0T11DRAFT_329922 [Plectosphaerella cucumerina]